MWTIPKLVAPGWRWLRRLIGMALCVLGLHRWQIHAPRRRLGPRCTVEPLALPGESPSVDHPRRKPEWVRQEVLRLAVHLRSCRRVADAFNRLHGQRQTVGHTFVHEWCRANATLIAQRRRSMRRRLPQSAPRNAVWALDLTQLPTRRDGSRLALGVIDHGSRRLLRIQCLARKCTWTLLGQLCLAIAEFGRPGAVRTDNEAMFNSRLWRRALKWAGIRHQRSAPGCPWQNGRIERLFCTLKPLLRDLVLPTQAAAQAALDEFADFYNRVRPHQSLGGLTPIEAWHGLTRQDVLRQAGRGHWVQALDGRLVGYHLRL